MSAKDLSILIPARNEEWLAKTIEDILSHIEADTEVITVLDGQWANPPIKDHPRVNIIYLPESIGQRAATNLAARQSKAKYLMKVDAHCAFDQAFDAKMIEGFKGHDDWTMAPTMRNLHVFDWVCTDGHVRYQGRSGGCREVVNGQHCGKPTKRRIAWEPRRGTRNWSYCFDSEPHFQYFRSFSKRPEGQGDITPSMSLQGSCFMLTREKYWELDICDEVRFPSWGSQGIEVACKTWLSGGKVMINHNTWYAHLFRTQGGDFGFPYPQSETKVQSAKQVARELFFEGKWEKQKRPLSWLIEQFMPIGDALEGGTKWVDFWTQGDVDKLKQIESGKGNI